MCGICGKVNFNGGEVSRELITEMSSRLSHRGPDAEGIYVKHGTTASVGLGHKRLSIIDLSQAGVQPMSNEDKSVWMVFNGEIYNFQELRQDLESQGHRFNSQTDCEVVIHLYEQEGIQCLEKLGFQFTHDEFYEPTGLMHPSYFLDRERYFQMTQKQ